MTRLEIVPRRRLRGALHAVLVAVVLGTSGYLLFVREDPSVETPPGLLASRTAMREQIAALLEERETLQRRVAVLEREQQIERRAYEEVERHLVELQGDVLDLREDVAFYEAIVSSPAKKHLSIQTLHLTPQGLGNAWRFQVVLTRNTKISDNVLAGRVRLAVHGEHQGKAQHLTLSDLSADRVGALEFQFRYFQRLEGRLILPPDFVPQRVVVQAAEKGADGPPVEREFDWPTALTARAGELIHPAGSPR